MIKFDKIESLLFLEFTKVKEIALTSLQQF